MGIGNRVGRVGYLADEAAVLAHRMREPDAHAGGPAIQHFLEYALVFGDSADFPRLVEPGFSHSASALQPSIVCLI